MCQGPERQQEISTAHATSEQTVLKFRTKPCVRKSNQCFFLWQWSTSTICNSLKQTQVKTFSLPYFQLAKKSQLLLFPSLNHRNIPSSTAYSHISHLFLTQILAVLLCLEFYCLAEI